jgi:hypothetical protein
MNKFFVTGMVRSGTSLISRSLDAHAHLVCALDPCLGFFRSVRNELLHQTDQGCPDPEAPFTDFFFSRPPGVGLYLQADLHRPIRFEPLEVTRERMRHFNRDSNATLLVPWLDKLGREKNYAELLEAILGLLQEAYGSKSSRWIGFVQTWVEAFAPVLLNTWPDLVCVHIIRDPRAVIASWLHTTDLTHDYPFLMILRNWRKSAALASRFCRLYGDRYLVWRYEDFVSDPAGCLTGFCRRLGLEFDRAMTETAKFRGGGGEHWQSNTSYETPHGISHQFKDKWRQRLSEADLQFIEDSCAPEMARWNYPRVTAPGAPASLLNLPELARQVQGEAEWISHYAEDYRPGPVNQAKELFRWFLWSQPHAALALSGDDLESVLIDPALVGTGDAAANPVQPR